MKTVVLTGMMGSGKTTVGSSLAVYFHLQFFDIDKIIEEKEQMSISKIFELYSEDYFRRLEKDTIKNIFKSSDTIISLGGGAFEDKETRQFLNENSTVIYLQTSAETILQRLKDDKTRPLLCDNMSLEKIQNLIDIREKNYETASHIITTDDKKPLEIIREIIGVLLW